MIESIAISILQKKICIVCKIIVCCRLYKSMLCLSCKARYFKIHSLTSIMVQSGFYAFTRRMLGNAVYN